MSTMIILFGFTYIETKFDRKLKRLSVKRETTILQLHRRLFYRCIIV